MGGKVGSAGAGASKSRAELIEMLISCGALRTDRYYTLKSKRESPYFLNIGDVNSGAGSKVLTRAYADCVTSNFKTGKPIVFYGIPEKGVALAPAVSMALLQEYGIESWWFFTRKTEASEHGSEPQSIADFNSGSNTLRLANAYTDAIITHLGGKFDLVYGMPEKGVSLTSAVSVALSQKNVASNWFFMRKISKTHGESTNLQKSEAAKGMIVGRQPQDGSRIVMLTDRFDAAAAKSAIGDLGKLANDLHITAIITEDAGSAGKAAEFAEETRIPVYTTSNVPARPALSEFQKIAASGAIIPLDDVFTTGETKYGAITTINRIVPKPEIAGFVIAADRQEVGADSKSAIEEFTTSTRIRVFSALDITTIRRHLAASQAQGHADAALRIAKYLGAYGTDASKAAIAAETGCAPS